MSYTTDSGNTLYDHDDDPNQQLIGKRYTTAQGTPAQEDVEIIGTVEYSKGQYMIVKGIDSGMEIMKPFAVLQRHLQIVGRLDGNDTD